MMVNKKIVFLYTSIAMLYDTLTQEPLSVQLQHPLARYFKHVIDLVTKCPIMADRNVIIATLRCAI